MIIAIRRPLRRILPVPRRLFRSLVLGGLALGPLGAYAQVEGSGPQPAAGASSSTQQTLDVVVVTAERRKEKNVDVPISTSVLSTTALQATGVSSVSDLAQVVPGLRIDGSGPYSQPSIRGISSVIVGAGIASNIATYVDGFYHPDPLGNDMSFYDTDSVQVLKGPQGTLFGRNSTGGAILVSTMDPSFTPAAEVRVGYGNYNATDEMGFVTAPINNVLAFSISGHLGESDGFDHNIVTGDREGDSHDGSVRGKLLYAPNDGTEFILSLDHTHADDPNGFLYSAYKGQTDGPIYYPGTAVASQRGQVANNDPDLYRNDVTGAYLTGKFTLGSLKLTSYTGHQYIDVGALSFDLDTSAAPFGALNFPEKDRITTQEFDLNGAEGRLNWVSGLFYMDQAASQQFYETHVGEPIYQISNVGQGVKAYAAFLDGTYGITDSLFLTLGGRYGIDQNSAYSGFGPTFIATPLHHTFHGADYRAVLRYKLDPNSNLYASYSKGSKAGAFNPSNGDPEPVKPERINAYEVGYKVARHGWHFETAVFDYEYRDMQVVEYVGNYANLVNASAARIYGYEGHLGFDLTNALSLDTGAGYTHGTYLSFINAERYLFSPTTGVAVFPGSNASGDSTERTPKFNGDLALTYHRTLAGGTLRLTGSYSYQSKINFDPFGDTHQGGYGLLNSSAAWTTPGNDWTVTLYGKNVTNTRYLLQVNQETAATFQLYGRPATYGIQVAYSH